MSTLLRMWPLRFVVLSLYFVIQWYLYRKACRLWEEAKSPHPRSARRRLLFIRSFFVLVNAPMLIALFSLNSISRMPTVFLDAALGLFSAWVAISILVAVFVFLTDLVRWGWKKLARLRANRPWASSESFSSAGKARRQFLRTSSLALASVPFAMTGYQLVLTRKRFHVQRTTVHLERLPDGFRGWKIAQLSDIHFGMFLDEEELAACVKQVNALDADLIFLTGDFLGPDPRQAAPCVQVLKNLQAHRGIYGCLGNHEIYTDTRELFTREFAKHDIRMLRNATEEISMAGEKLALLGVDYLRRGRYGMVEALAKMVPEDRAKILLSHQPNVFPSAERAKIDLTVSGHTHGGQIKLQLGPMELVPSLLISPYTEGLFTINASKLYVSRGIGMTAIPLRINAPAEITLIELA